MWNTAWRGDAALPRGDGGADRGRWARREGAGRSVRVPLDRAHPALGHITVRYAVLRHTDRTRPPLEPVVAFEGGPGYGSIGSAST